MSKTHHQDRQDYNDDRRDSKSRSHQQDEKRLPISRKKRETLTEEQLAHRDYLINALD